MLRSLRPFLIALVCSWVVLFGAAFFYSQQHPSFHWLWTAALPAFALETLFYLSSVLEKPREVFRAVSIPFTAKAGILWSSALLPYAVFSLLAGTFQAHAFYLLFALTGVLSLWHLLMPRRVVYDIGFLIIAAAPFITRVFGRIYLSPNPGLKGLDILGHLMWIRVGVVAILLFREWEAGPVSIWPSFNDWKIGLTWFAAGIVPVCTVALGLHALKLRSPVGPWWRWVVVLALYFFAFLFSSSFGEELFFRGVMERALLNGRRSPAVAIAISAVLFGSVHLWFGHYPNWHWVTIATVLGIFCGVAYWRAQSIRASMVTHALTIAVWKLLFI